MSRYLLVKVSPGAQKINSTISRISIMTNVSDVQLLPVKTGNAISKSIKKIRYFTAPKRGILTGITDIMESMISAIFQTGHTAKIDQMQGDLQKLKRRISK